MRWIWQGCVLGCVLAIIITAGSGCNMMSIPFYLFGPEEKIPASMTRLASKDKDKEVKVLIWTWATPEVKYSAEYARADEKLAQKLYDELKIRCAANKENVVFVPYKEIERYKQQVNENIAPDEAGEHFKADYVIYLEVQKFALTMQNSLDQLLEGVAAIHVTLMDLKRDQEMSKKEDLQYTWPPKSRGGVDENDYGNGNSKQIFCNSFLDYVARQLAWKFTDHPAKEENQVR
jgi:hypothetical protein